MLICIILATLYALTGTEIGLAMICASVPSLRVYVPYLKAGWREISGSFQKSSASGSGSSAADWNGGPEKLQVFVTTESLESSEQEREGEKIGLGIARMSYIMVSDEVIVTNESIESAGSCSGSVCDCERGDGNRGDFELIRLQNR